MYFHMAMCFPAPVSAFGAFPKKLCTTCFQDWGFANGTRGVYGYILEVSGHICLTFDSRSSRMELLWKPRWLPLWLGVIQSARELVNLLQTTNVSSWGLQKLHYQSSESAYRRRRWFVVNVLHSCVWVLGSQDTGSVLDFIHLTVRMEPADRSVRDLFPTTIAALGA